VSRFVAVAAVVFAATAIDAKVFLSQEEALRLAFPAATIERKTAFLTSDQQREAQRLSGNDAPPSALAVYYVATKDGREIGTAYFDTHVVRTMSETIMVVVDPAGNASRVEVLSFQEPEDYLPRPHWYEQFQGKRLDDELSMKRGIRPISGATLTARATIDATRRVLALHQIIQHAPARKGSSP
jgi:Na+-translocating ferredoxin:NAD+ oxidoreductase RnfG subunit